MFPARFEAIKQLGFGGAGEVWSVHDRITGRKAALKVLASSAGHEEIMALVREATALNGVEGLAFPRILRFGTLPGSGRPYLVRDLVEGESLAAVIDKANGGPWVEPMVSACDQLTALHRGGLFHGDIKPANIIANRHGDGTLVDFGLSAPWRHAGTLPVGLTPKYAAPELRQGGDLTVRAEVYAFGATLRESLERRGCELDPTVRSALETIASRATRQAPEERFPSIDEFAGAVRNACGIAPPSRQSANAWPIVGIDDTSRALLAQAEALPQCGCLLIDGPQGSGKTTLVRRLAWSLGARGAAVAIIDASLSNLSPDEALRIELESATTSGSPPFVIVDDFDLLPSTVIDALEQVARSGGRLIAIGRRERILAAFSGHIESFFVPPLEAHFARALIAQTIPSLSTALCEHIYGCAEGRPGALRAIVKRLGDHVFTSVEEINATLAPPSEPAVPARASIESIERAIERGHIDDAASLLSTLSRSNDAGTLVRVAIADAHVLVGRGDALGAGARLDDVEAEAMSGAGPRAWLAARGRAAVRCGDYRRAHACATRVIEADISDSFEVQALCVLGIASSFTGDDTAAIDTLERAVQNATRLQNRRDESVALGSLAIVHQRAGRPEKARTFYEQALRAAEAAQDAAAVAATRINIAMLAQADGDFGLALTHLEATLDIATRAGSGLATQQALLNLANLDLYLGRYSRAHASIESLAKNRSGLPATAEAQLLGLEAELATRSGDPARGASLYERCGNAWRDSGRPHDAAEAHLEALLVRSKLPGADPEQLAASLEQIRQTILTGNFGEHSALEQLVFGAIALLRKDDAEARRAFDSALSFAQAGSHREWSWRALDARARLSAAKAEFESSRQDVARAVSLLEETASNLPRDLREVFWDDPRRRALGQAHTSAAPFITPSAASASNVLASSTSKPVVAQDRLARILELTRELAREHDMPTLLARVTDHAVSLLGADRGLVLLLNESGEFETHASHIRRGDENHVRFSRYVAKQVVESGEPVITIDANSDERLSASASVHQLMIRSIACVPIRGAPPACLPIGALYIETRLRPNSRFQAELPTLSAFADQAAVAIEYARLLAENRLRSNELSQANAELATARDKLASRLGQRTEQLAEARRDLREARSTLRGHFGYGGMIGTSAAMRRVYAIIERVKDTDVPALITGESGTGKEVVAKAIHSLSPRGRMPFIGINCGAIPEHLLESELFGHLRGAFTGADRERKGLFREAEGGTVLLDEIGDLPARMQTALLRALQEKCVRPVGGANEVAIDVRVLAATHRDLAQMVADGLFREDLYYRLHVIEIRLPALRERVEDMPPLVDHFLSLFAARYKRPKKSLTRDAMRQLCAHPWPGNIRQLDHVLLNAWLMSDGEEIGLDDIDWPNPPARSVTAPRGGEATRLPTTEAEHRISERDRIVAALAASNWNRLQAAKLLGLPRRTFYRRLSEFGILEAKSVDGAKSAREQ